MQNKILRTVTVIGALLIACIVIIDLSAFLSALGAIAGIIMPISVGLCIAFVINIPLTLLERLWDKIDKHSTRRYHHAIKRAVCLFICIAGLGGIIFLFVLTVTPYLEASLTSLFNALPVFVDKLQALWDSLSEKLAAYSIRLPELDLDTEKISSALTEYFSKNSDRILNISIGFASSVVSTVFNVILAAVISVYVLAKKERLRIQAKRILWAFFPEERCKSVLNVASLTASTFARFLTGQLAEAVILGVLCLIGMLIFGFPYAALISLIIGVTALIPIFGAFIGIGVGALLILLYDPLTAVWFLVFITVLQQIETNIIYPRVVGKSVGLPALWVLIAVTVGSSFGIIGMLISVPLVSVIYCLAGQLVSARLEKKLDINESLKK